LLALNNALITALRPDDAEEPEVRGRLIETAVGAHLLRGAQPRVSNCLGGARPTARWTSSCARAAVWLPSRSRAQAARFPARLGPLRAPPSRAAGCLSGEVASISRISFSPTLSVGSQINYDPPVGVLHPRRPRKTDALLDVLAAGARRGCRLYGTWSWANVLLHAQRKRRIDKAGIEKFLSALNVYDIEVDPRR